MLFDVSLIEQHAALDAALKDALIADTSGDGALGDLTRTDDLTREVIALEERIAAEEHVFVFEGIGHEAWEILVEEHRPTEQQLADGMPWNPHTFPPVAVAVSCVESDGDANGVSLDDAQWMHAELDLAEWSKVWGACLTANLGDANRPKSVIATATASTFAKRSTTAHPAGSPSRRSSNGRKRT